MYFFRKPELKQTVRFCLINNLLFFSVDGIPRKKYAIMIYTLKCRSRYRIEKIHWFERRRRANQPFQTLKFSKNFRASRKSKARVILKENCIGFTQSVIMHFMTIFLKYVWNEMNGNFHNLLRTTYTYMNVQHLQGIDFE